MERNSIDQSQSEKKSKPKQLLLVRSTQRVKQQKIKFREIEKLWRKNKIVKPDNKNMQRAHAAVYKKI